MIYFIFWIVSSVLLIISMILLYLFCPWLQEDYTNGRYPDLDEDLVMNIKDQTKHCIYYNNLKLAEIRANIEDEIKRVDAELINEPSNSIYSAELNELRNNLEAFYQKIG